MIEFETELWPSGPAAAFVLSDEQVAEVGGGKKTFPVKVTVDDYEFAGRLTRRGDKNLIGLSRAVREAGGLEPGARYVIRVELDTAERTVEVPEALATALDGAGLRGAFDALSYSARKEMARTVAEAKGDDTRERRVAKALEKLGA